MKNRVRIRVNVSKMDMKDLSIQESVHRYIRGLNHSLYSFIDENEESFSLTRENDKSFVELKNQEVRVCRVVSVERKAEDYLASLKTVLEEDNKLVVKAQSRDSRIPSFEVEVNLKFDFSDIVRDCEKKQFLAVVRFWQWKASDLQPRGKLIRILGNEDDYKTQADALMV